MTTTMPRLHLDDNLLELVRPSNAGDELSFADDSTLFIWMLLSAVDNACPVLTECPDDFSIHFINLPFFLVA